MDNAQLIGLSRQVALARNLEVVANNIANVNTTGFKGDSAIFEEFLSLPARESQTTGGIELPLSFVQDRGVWHDFAQGAMQSTGNPLDVAIGGEGFLVVQSPDGERYTRNGALQIAANGQLVTNDGMPVLGENGPITFQPTDRNIAISKDGRVTVNEGADFTHRRISRQAPRRALRPAAATAQGRHQQFPRARRRDAGSR